MAWVIDRVSVSSDFLEGEVVAIHLGTGIYYSLRGPAAVIWQALDQPAEAVQLGALLAAQFAVTPAQAEQDVIAFLFRLETEGLVRPAADSGTPVPVVAGGSILPYVTPQFERFSDLQDLLLLDPIHDVGPEGWPHRPPAADSP
jgi:hypothetical protein